MSRKVALRLMFQVAEAIFTADQLALFFIFFVPGFIAVKVYDLFVPHESRNWQNALFEVVAYSTLNFVVIAGLVALGTTVINLPAFFFKVPPALHVSPVFWFFDISNLGTNLHAAQGPLYFVLVFVVLLGMPALLSFSVFKASQSAVFRRKLQMGGMPSVWDSVFSYEDLDKREDDGYFVIVHLKGGGKRGGFFSNRSKASRFPHKKELFIQKEYKVNSDGSFGGAIDHTAGVLITSDEIEAVEFFAY